MASLNDQKGAKVFATCNEINRLSKPVQSRFRRLHLLPYTKEQFLDIAVKAGLAPSKRESGTTHRIGDSRRITRQGSRWIRFTIVESATTQ